jgi:hypothetical protein
MVTIPLGLVERDPDLLGTGTSDDVVIARRSLSETVFSELEKFSYRPRLANQEDGAAGADPVDRLLRGGLMVPLPAPPGSASSGGS